MLEIDRFASTICGKIPEGLTFQPSDTSLTDYFPSMPKRDEEEITLVTIGERDDWIKPQKIAPRYPEGTQVIAIDSTSITLGQLPDGLVGAVRASIVVKPAGSTNRSLERYGPYLVPVTNQNKDHIYRSAFKAAYGRDTDAHAPDCYMTLDRVRNFLERYIQLEIVKCYKDSIILIDGSLIGGTVGDPEFVVKKIVADATSNRNSIVAISKSTRLTLQQTQKSILSLLEDVPGPCCIGNVKSHITQDASKYHGHVYVARLTPLGEPFRIDVPEGTPIPHPEIFSHVAGLAGDYGYPEELKLAHMTCVLSSIEIIELQSAAIVLHGLSLKEELRPKIFPL
jgi:hypothetical protein